MEVSTWVESTDFFYNFLFQRHRYGTSSAAALLVENINGTSLFEVQDNNSISGDALKNF